MTQTAYAEMVTANGLKGTFDRAALEQTAPTELVGIELQNGQQLWVLPSTLLLQPDGRFLLPVAVPEANPRGQATQAARQRETTILPVVAEEVVVTKRPVESGGVRVSKVVHEHEEVARLPLRHEEIEVRREPADEIVTQPEPARQEGSTWVVPVYEEVLVVEKRLRLRERLFVTKHATVKEQQQPVTLRREEAVVERLEPEAGETPARP